MNYSVFELRAKSWCLDPQVGAQGCWHNFSLIPPAELRSWKRVRKSGGFLSLEVFHFALEQHPQHCSSHCLKITQNVSFSIFQFWHFSTIFVLFKLTCLVTLFDLKLQFFKNSPIPFLYTQNVNIARFARNVEWDFFCDFQTLCVLLRILG